MELLAEPLYILASVRLWYRLRVGVEGAAMAAKGVATLALLRAAALPPPLAFSWGQLAYAGVTLAGYAAAFVPEAARALGARRRARHDERKADEQAAAGAGAVRGGGEGWWELDRSVLRTSATFSLQVSGCAGGRAGACCSCSATSAFSLCVRPP